MIKKNHIIIFEIKTFEIEHPQITSDNFSWQATVQEKARKLFNLEQNDVKQLEIILDKDVKFHNLSLNQTK